MMEGLHILTDYIPHNDDHGMMVGIDFAFLIACYLGE